MSRRNGSYHGKFTKEYTDYDINYYSSMEGKGDNFDYMSKVSKEHYIHNSFNYDKRALAHQDTRDHHIVHQAQRQHDLPHRTRLSLSRSSSRSNHVGDHERRRQPQEHGANHKQPTWCPCLDEPIYNNVHDNSSRRTTTRAPRLPSHDMSYQDATFSPMVSPIPHDTSAKAPTRQSHRHEKHSKDHDCHHQSHHEHPQQDQE
jgi:hypothetical protein